MGENIKKEEGILLPKLENSCDDVYDRGAIGFMLRVKVFFHLENHIIIEASESGEQGWCEMLCSKIGKRYRHYINCPNTFELICRGCKKTISG